MDYPLDEIKQFLIDNVDQFTKPNAKYKETTQQIIDAGYPVHPLMGKCFPSSKFIQTLFGPENISLHCIPSKLLPFIRIDGEKKFTTHWFTKCKKSGRILDATIEQFIYEPFNVEFVQSLYPRAYERDFGNKYENGVALPSKEVMRFIDLWNKR